MEKKYPLSKQEFAKKMKEKRKKLFDIADHQLEITCTQPNKYLEFLRLLAIHGYDITNTLLIQAQHPDAILLKDVARFREDGLHIKKGEKGIAIFQPGTSYVRRDGSTGINYNVKHVFDITQTSSESIPSPIEYDKSQLAYAFTHKEKDSTNNSNASDDSYLIHLLKSSCQKEGDNMKRFCIQSVIFALCQKYRLHYEDHFSNACISSLKTMDKINRKNTLKSIKRLFDTINNRIEHGLYVYDQEVNGNA